MDHKPDEPDHPVAMSALAGEPLPEKTSKDIEVNMVELGAAAAAPPAATSSTRPEYRPQPVGYWKLWFRQFYVMMRKNLTLTFVRYWPTTLLQVISPFFFFIFLYALQQASMQQDESNLPYPVPYALEGVRNCVGQHNYPCISVMFAPGNDPVVKSIMQIFADNNNARQDTHFVIENYKNDITLPSSDLTVVPVPDDTYMYNYALAFPNVTSFGVMFFNEGSQYRYQLWYNSTQTTNTTQSVEEVYGLPLLSMIRGVDEAVVQHAASSQRMTLNVTIKDWPQVAVPGESTVIISQAGPTFFFGAAMVNFLTVLNTIVSEKEYKLRHGLQMMGLKSSVYWISWFQVNMLLVALISLVEVIFGYIFSFNVFTNTDFGVMFLLFFMFGMAMITFAFFITTFVRKVKAAVAVGMLVLVIGLVFMIAIFSSTFTAYIWWETSTNPAGWGVLEFLPFFNFGKLYVDISTCSAGLYSYATNTVVPGPGFPLSQLFEVIPKSVQPSYGTYNFPLPVQSLYNLLWNIFFYAFLTWVLDETIPDEYGQYQPVYFMFMPSYWGFRFSFFNKQDADPTMSVDIPQRETDEDEDVYMERVKALDGSKTGSCAIRLLQMKKVYNDEWFARGAKKIAVHGSSWTLEEGKLLALLGQNGAGKTTTMNMLNGFTKMSGGHAFMYGLPVATQMSKLRENMGVCPQHDILFSDLTAVEHIELFCGIKNIDPAVIPQLTQDRLEAVRLWKVKDQRAGTYSGGMKRRLSVAVSTIGDPQIIFMDEPTTGMDPLNRRHVWAFVEKFKQGRVIVLTTHSMEEADILGDQVAIMALGKLRAWATPIRLKNKFGAGYRVSVVTLEADSAVVKEDIIGRIPGIKLEDDSAGALIFNVPQSSLQRLPELVKYLDSGTNSKIREWGVSQTTLEEVFLRLIREVNPTGMDRAELKQSMAAAANGRANGAMD